MRMPKYAWFPYHFIGSVVTWELGFVADLFTLHVSLCYLAYLYCVNRFSYSSIFLNCSMWIHCFWGNLLQLTSVFLGFFFLPDFLRVTGKFKHAIVFTVWEWFHQFLFSLPWESSARTSPISGPGVRWPSYRVLRSFKKYDHILLKLLISNCNKTRDLDTEIFVLILSWTPSSRREGPKASCWRKSFCSSWGCWMET